MYPLWAGALALSFIPVVAAMFQQNYLLGSAQVGPGGRRRSPGLMTDFRPLTPLSLPEHVRRQGHVRRADGRAPRREPEAQVEAPEDPLLLGPVRRATGHTQP